MIDDVELERRIRVIEDLILVLSKDSGINVDQLKRIIRDRGGYPIDMDAYREALSRSFAAAWVSEERSKAEARKAA